MRRDGSMVEDFRMLQFVALKLDEYDTLLDMLVLN